MSALRSSDVALGRRYHVKWKDCCTCGEFTSTVVSTGSERYEGDDVLHVTDIWFKNGVHLTGTFDGVLLTEVKTAT